MSEEQAEYKIDGRPHTIFHVVHDKDNPYVMVDRRIIDNTKLSFKAKGILIYLLSRPDGWEVNLLDLANRSLDGLSAVKSGVKELKDAGHLKHAGTRKASGQFETVIWEVYECPQVGNQLTDALPVGVSPQVDYPQVENPQVDNRIQVLSTLSSKESSNKDNIHTETPNFQDMTVREAMAIPELQVFRDATGYFPGAPLWETIYNDLHEHGWSGEQIKKPWVEWNKRGYNTKSLSWMEWIGNPIPERNIPKNDTTRNPRNVQADRLKSLAEA